MNRFLMLFWLCCVLSCNDQARHSENENVAVDNALQKDSIRYELFAVEKGYGFDIVVNGKTFIHQPVIPYQEGLNGFATVDAAEVVANSIVEKLQSNNHSFLINKYEIDSLINAKKSIGEEIVGKTTPYLVTKKILLLEPSDKKGDILIEDLPHLQDAPVKNLWQSKGIVPFESRAGSINFTIGNFIFIGAGETKDATMDDFWSFNTLTNAWTCLAEIPGGGRVVGTSFAMNNKGYAGSGAPLKKSLSYVFKRDFYEYDPAQNKWFAKEDFPGLPTIATASFVIHDKGYVGSGYDENYRKDFYEYDPSNDKWRRIADFPGGPVAASIGVSTGKKGFIIAGDRLLDNQRFVYEYLPGTDKWQKKTDFPGLERFQLSGFCIDTNYFIAGAGRGEHNFFLFRDFFLYDILKDRWIAIPDYPVSKAGIAYLSGGSVNGKIYAGTGNRDGDFMNTWNMYEYYFSVRKDTGDYNETVCYATENDDNWQLFQECMADDCFAGVAIRTKEALGDFCYSSKLTDTIRTVVLNDGPSRKKKFFLPRNYTVQVEKQPNGTTVFMRLFFTRQELERSLQDCMAKTGIVYNLSDLQVLQCNEKKPDTDPANNSYQKESYNIISPQWFRYGFNNNIVVAQFPVSFLDSEFYLILP